MTEVLLAADALVTGGTALAQAIGGLAPWLGVPGNGILDLLHAAGSPGTGR